MTAPSIQSIHSQTLDLPPSCVQFCPTRPGIFCIGTYLLHRREQQGDLSGGNNRDPSDTCESEGTAANDDEASRTEETEEEEEAVATTSTLPQKRTGSLILFRLDEHDNSITRLSTLPTDSAVLDLQWNCQPNSEEILAVATSTGRVVFYRLSATTTLEHAKTVIISEDPFVLVLSLTWHPSRHHVLGVTLSDGRVLVLHSEQHHPLWSPEAPQRQHDLMKTEIHSHELEAWICAFAPLGPVDEEEGVVVVSGGDDSSLRCSRFVDRQAAAAAGVQFLWRDTRLHQAGVTSILPLSDELVITGSYDDHIRLLRIPSLGRRQCLAELNLGGGVWRLKLLESSHDNNQGGSVMSAVLLASCMHAGSRIVKATRGEEDSWRLEVLARFEEHQSMNYGGDAIKREGKNRQVVSTSFYDKLLCLWEW